MAIEPSRFLVVAPYLPRPGSLHAGGRATAAWLAQLATRGRVELVAMGTAADAQAAAALWPALEEVEVVRYRSGWFARMAGALADLRRGGARGVHARLRAAVRERLHARRYSAVLVEHEETALWLDLEAGPAPLWLDCHDVISGHFEHDPAANPVPERLPTVADARAAEERLLRRYDRILVRSAADRARLTALAPEADVRLLRHPIELPATVTPRAGRVADRLLLTGSFRRAPNVAAARLALDEVLPALRRRRPAATLDLAGDGAREALGQPSTPGVRVLGRQASLAPHYEAAALFLNPTRAAGGVITRHLEALAHGLPVVTTPAGAEGLDLPGAVVTADSAEGLATAAAELLEDGARWQEMAARGREAVRARHAPAAVAAEFDALLDDLPGLSRRGRS